MQGPILSILDELLEGKTLILNMLPNSFLDCFRWAQKVSSKYDNYYPNITYVGGDGKDYRIEVQLGTYKEVWIPIGE